MSSVYEALCWAAYTGYFCFKGNTVLCLSTWTFESHRPGFQYNFPPPS